MKIEEIVKEAQAFQPEMKNIRRELHRHPEVGFALTFTKKYVWD